MQTQLNPEPLELLIVGAGPTGIAIGAAARAAGLNILLVDRGQLTQALLDFPSFMTFFTTRDKLEIANIPFCIPDEKPTRQQALIYYRAVADHYQLPLALHEEVHTATKSGDVFSIETSKGNYQARNIAFATGYFDHPFKLTVPGADQPWVHSYYIDPYRHFHEHMVIIGGGNSACETALDLWRNGAQSVTMIVRGPKLKEGVKYWVRPDVENRIAEGAITAHFNTQTIAFHENPSRVEIRHENGAQEFLPADAAFAFIGFHPDADLLRGCGVEVNPQTLVPKINTATCESNIPGLYIAGTIQAGLRTDQIFIENSRAHAPLIVSDILRRRQQEPK